MTSLTLPGMPTDRLGVIGTRQLVAVQTLDVARLTAHPICIVPETFIAVTGMGPVDSNESGKTSFLSAVALLLGDPEWRVTGTGASSVTALLFEPITAGIAVAATAATEGYIVGVFAEPEDVNSTAHTVWLKISSGRPHLQARHAPGIHLARGHDDRERHDAAPGIYRSLPNDPLGSTEYAQTLYGRSPRVLAYVASRGRVRSRPSLLKLDAGTFTPEQIGDALIALTGRATLFERDQQDRRDLAEKQAELARHIERDREHTAREAEILRQVEARQRLRRQSKSAAQLWRASHARSVLDAYARAESALHLLDAANTAHSDLQQGLTKLTADRDALRNPAALRQQLVERAEDLTKHKAAYDAGVRLDGALADKLATLEQDMSRARIEAAGHDLVRDGTVVATAQTRDDLGEDYGAAKHLLAEAEGAVTDHEDAVRQARDGQFGIAGSVIRALNAADISATSLADATRLDPTTRAEWEARLSPWREAVCLAGVDLPDALTALANLPGAILIAGHTTAGTHTDGGSRGLPPGIATAPAEAAAFLRALAGQTAILDPVAHALDTTTGVYVVGGFDVPIVGREDMLAHLTQRLEQSRISHRILKQKVAGLRASLEQARITALRAEAAQRVAALSTQTKPLTAQLAIHRNEILPPLQAARDEAWEAHEATRLALADRERNLNRLTDEVRAAEQNLRTKDAEIQRLTQASQPDDEVLAGWGRGLDAARVELGWPARTLEPDAPDRLVEEATPPPANDDADRAERRRATILHSAAHQHLGSALAAFGYHAEGTGAPPPDLLAAADHYVKVREDGDDPGDDLFEATLTSLQAWLDDQADRDETAHDEVQRARDSRATTTEFVGSQTRQLQEALTQTQQAISQRAAGALDRISAALDTLNRASGGIGAQLDHELIPPGSPDHDWVCRVTPRWRRNPGGPLLAYDNVTNTAQEKLFSIHLVLAALLAAPNPRGRVLILDELADSLGAEHRREVLEAIATVARDHGITILATCQDAIMAEARPYCKEVLYFHYPSRSEPLNRPTRMFALDPNGTRVEMTADVLTEGRGFPGTTTPTSATT
jgi:chromosome segregation protein